jgi:hypothetical protein
VALKATISPGKRRSIPRYDPSKLLEPGRLLGTCLRTGPTAAASRLPQEE